MFLLKIFYTKTYIYIHVFIKNTKIMLFYHLVNMYDAVQVVGSDFYWSDVCTVGHRAGQSAPSHGVTAAFPWGALLANGTIMAATRDKTPSKGRYNSTNPLGAALVLQMPALKWQKIKWCRTGKSRSFGLSVFTKTQCFHQPLHVSGHCPFISLVRSAPLPPHPAPCRLVKHRFPKNPMWRDWPAVTSGSFQVAR